jgi:hypothetical protein
MMTIAAVGVAWYVAAMIYLMAVSGRRIRSYR